MNNSNIIFVLGPPGAGKGTLCKRLAASHNLAHVSTGDLCRAAVLAPNPDPLVVEYMSRLQPLTAEMLFPILRAKVEELRRGKRGQGKGQGEGQEEQEGCTTLVLDGFPRKMEQLGPFEDMFGDPLVVLFFDCPPELAEERVVNRVADRAGDDRETFKRRYGEFLQWNPPICEYYGKKGKIVSIDTSGSQEESYANLVKGLRERDECKDLFR